ARRQFLQQLVDIAADEQRAVIFSTHIVSDVERVANQVWMMRDGQLTYQGGLDELKESVAKVTLRAAEAFTERFSCPNLINQKIQQNIAQLTFMHWSDEQKNQLLQQFPGDIEIQRLGLEDIFLEMNA